MDKFKLVSMILKEFGNCSAGIAAYESPARPFKQSAPKKKRDMSVWLKRSQKRRGEI